MITYALLSRGGAFGKGGGRSLTVPPCKQTDLPTDSSRTQKIYAMIGFRFGSVQASRCTEPEPGSGLLHDSPEIPLLSTSTSSNIGSAAQRSSR